MNAPPSAQPPHNHVGILCFLEPGSAQRILCSGSGGAHPSWVGALAPAHCPRPCPPSLASQLTFLYRRAQRPPPWALPFLEETVSDGICGSRRKQAVSGGVVGLTQRAPGQGLRKGALAPGVRLGARAARLLLPEPGPGVRRVEPLHNAQVRKRVQEKGNPLSERAGGSLIKPSRDCVSRAGAHGAQPRREEKRAPGRLGRWERSKHGGEEPRGRRGDARRTATSRHCTRTESPTTPKTPAPPPGSFSP